MEVLIFALVSIAAWIMVQNKPSMQPIRIKKTDERHRR